MLKKSKTVSFQSPIVQDNETSEWIQLIQIQKSFRRLHFRW